MSSLSIGSRNAVVVLVVISCDDVTCNPHNGDSKLVIGSGGGISALLLAEGMFVGCE